MCLVTRAVTFQKECLRSGVDFGAILASAARLSMETEPTAALRAQGTFLIFRPLPLSLSLSRDAHYQKSSLEHIPKNFRRTQAKKTLPKNNKKIVQSLNSVKIV